MIVGIPTGSVDFNFLQVVKGEKNVHGVISHVYDEDYKNAIWLLGEGRIQVEPLITRRIRGQRRVRLVAGTSGGHAEDHRGAGAMKGK